MECYPLLLFLRTILRFSSPNMKEIERFRTIQNFRLLTWKLYRCVQRTRPITNEVDQALSHCCLHGADAPRIWVACVPCPRVVPAHELRLATYLTEYAPLKPRTKIKIPPTVFQSILGQRHVRCLTSLFPVTSSRLIN